MPVEVTRGQRAPSPDDDAVIHREAVRGQAGDVPGTDGHGVAQRGDEAELTGAGDAPLLHSLHPLQDLLLQYTSNECIKTRYVLDGFNCQEQCGIRSYYCQSGRELDL